MSPSSPNGFQLQRKGAGVIEITRNGKPAKVRCITVDNNIVVVEGGWVRVAVVHDEAWLERELEDPERYVERLKEDRGCGLRANIFSFAQKLPATDPKYAYPIEWESIAAIRLTTFQEWWEKLPQESRKNVRRSQKRGVEVRTVSLTDDLVRGLVELNNDSPVRQGRLYTHFGKTFEQVKKDQSDFLDHCEFVGAYHREELIGFMKIVYQNDTASILQLLPKASQSDKRPANALIAKAVELCVDKKMCYLVFGMYNYGNKGDNPMREFKTRHGFAEVLVPRYFIPLTVWGSFCTKAKLYRPLIGILPGSIIKFGVTLRAKWYRFKLSISRCSSMPERPNCTRQMERSIPPAGSKL